VESATWEAVILEVCRRLEDADIKYHADASSSLYVHGFSFDMDDFDVTVEWNKIDKARELFADHTPCEVTGVGPKRFQFTCMGRLVDVMAYQSNTGIGPEDERVCVNFAGDRVWSKVSSFYLHRMEKQHPIRKAAFQFFKIDD